MNVNRQLKELTGSSQRIPSDRDFHFYCNFDDFKRPIEEIARRTQSMLEQIGDTTQTWNSGVDFPADLDDAYDWVVDMNDELLEWFDESESEVRKVREEEEFEEMELENGLGLIRVKKEGGAGLKDKRKKTTETGTGTGTEKQKVSFHLATVTRPQEVYDIVVNNVNQPFEHVWLERSDDGQRFIHPLEKYNVLDFVDKDFEDLVPIKPLALECTPFKFVEDVKGLKELAAKLRSVDEFAVDLEHNQYRSFQGLTCLMQISTRTEDFIVDTFKLRVHVGPYLREVFKDPTKKKVLHGADRDIVWLQRDFGIYVCNMFDTGQASRVLKLERNSLLFLLQHFCGVTANKEYQNADWRQRPLPDVMLRYGREDTHYLLYIYDQMRIKLFALSKESESSDNPLLEVYKRSYDVCMQLYEKELLTENSYLDILYKRCYDAPDRLRGAGFNAQQLAIVSGLTEWRDILARAEDESTGYILPNKILLEIAKQMPVTISSLRRLTTSRLPYLDRNLDVIVNIVRHSIQNAAAFEEAALCLKEDAARVKEAHAASVKEADEASVKEADEASVSDVVHVEDGTEAPPLKVEHAAEGSIGIDNATCFNISGKSPFPSEGKEECLQHEDTNGQVKFESNCLASEFPLDNGANSQVQKRPTGAFGVALLDKSALKQKLDPDEKVSLPVNLPYHSKVVVETPGVASDPQKPISGPVSTFTPDDMMMMMMDSDIDLEDMMQDNL